MSVRVWTFLLCWIGLVYTIPSSASELAVSAPHVVATLPPMAYVADRIVGGDGHALALIPSGNVEETYSPSPRQLKALSDADVLFRIGHPNFPFEQIYVDPLVANLQSIAIVSLVPADELPGLKKIAGVTAHDHEHEFLDPQQDPHRWLSLSAMRAAALNLEQVLAARYPMQAAQFQKNAESLVAEVDALRAEIATRLTPLRGKTVLVYHPAWGCFLREFGLQQRAIEADGKSPSAQQIKALVEFARASGIKVVFAEHGHSVKTAQVVADEIGGRVVELDPLAYDWLANMRRVSEALISGVKP